MTTAGGPAWFGTYDAVSRWHVVRAMEVGCPTCGAVRRYRCVSRTGRPIPPSQSHGERFKRGHQFAREGAEALIDEPS